MNQTTKGHFRKNWFFYTLIILLSGFSTYQFFYERVIAKKHEKEISEAKTQITEEANALLQSSTEGQLDLFMKAFVWSVRSEMTRDNMEQVEQYFRQLVKSDNIEEIMLTDTKGKILIATNQKREGTQLNESYTETALQANEITILNTDERTIVLAPVFSVNNRLAGIVLTYLPPKISLEKAIADLAMED